MNTLRFIFLALLLAVQVPTAFSFEQRNLNSSQKKELDEMVKTVEALFKGTWGKGSKEKKEGCKKNQHRMGTKSKPSEMSQGMLEILDGLYTSGYFKTPSEIDAWINKYWNLKSSGSYRKLRKNDKDGDTDWHDGAVVSGCNRKTRWKNLYKDFAKSLKNTLRNRKITCANLKDIATTKQCCDHSDLNPYSPDAFPFVGYKKPDNSSCIDSGLECSSHADCCSEQCMKHTFNGDTKGRCAPVLSCYSRIPKGQECHPIERPYCATPWTVGGYFNQKEFDVVCSIIDHKSVGVGECNNIGDSCSSNSQCCSDKCSNGKCDFKAECMVCINNGDPYNEADGIPCCPGYMPGMDKKRCEPKFPPLILPQGKITPKIESIFEKIWNLIFPSAYAAGEACNYFSPAQKADLKSKTEGCFTEGAENEKGVNECLKIVTALKDQYRISNYTEETKKMQEAIKACGGDTACRDKARKEFQEKCNSAGMDRIEYAQAYNIPAIRSKTTSNLKTCQFNNLNDAWAQATPDERNAQLVIMAFEYLFSGGGAQDYWVQKGNGKNIFQRSKEIASILKRKRVARINTMHQKDTLMMCQCVLAQKGKNIPESVMSVFNTIPECELEKAALDKMNESEDVSYAVGATGISHESFLVNYTAMKSDTSVDEFSDYTEVNEKMDSLSKYINGEGDNPVNWYEAETRSTVLYTFKVKWMATWFKIFLVVIAIAIVLTAIVLTGGALGAGLGSAMASVGSSVGFSVLGIGAFSFTGAVAIGITTVTLATAVVSAGVAALFKNRTAKPRTLDRVIESKNNAAAYDEQKKEYVWKYGKKTNWLGTHKYFKIERSYVYPYYKSQTSSCEIYASANLCLRNMFFTVTNDGMRYLTDVKKPLYVSNVAWPDDINFIGGVNANFGNLINKLKATNPGGTTKRKFLKRDILSEPEIQKAMIPFSQNYLPDAFDEQKALRVYNGVKRYSKCKEITGDKAKADCRVQIGDFGVEEGDMGFGYFFENEEDINDFAAYFYQHHFHWPSTTASSQIGYPLLGQNIYYQTILHNIRVIMAAAADRGNKFGELYDLYKSDWDKRVKDYDCSGGGQGAEDSAICAAIRAGGDSYNVKYSQAFRASFKRLDFRMGELPAQYAETGEINLASGESSGKGLSASESALLKDTANQALANARQRKKNAYYNETVGKTERGKSINNAFKKWNKNFSSPLSNMKLTKAGQQWGGEGGSRRSSTTNNITNNYDDLKKDLNDSFGVSSYKAPEYNFNGSGGNSYGSSSYGAGSSSGPTYSKNKADKNSDASKDADTAAAFADSTSSNLGFFKRDDSDSLFQIVSKAYQRNLNRVLIKRKEEPKIKDLDQEK